MKGWFTDTPEETAQKAYEKRLSKISTDYITRTTAPAEFDYSGAGDISTTEHEHIAKDTNRVLATVSGALQKREAMIQQGNSEEIANKAMLDAIKDTYNVNRATPMDDETALWVSELGMELLSVEAPKQKDTTPVGEKQILDDFAKKIETAVQPKDKKEMDKARAFSLGVIPELGRYITDARITNKKTRLDYPLMSNEFKAKLDENSEKTNQAEAYLLNMYKAYVQSSTDDAEEFMERYVAEHPGFPNMKVHEEMNNLRRDVVINNGDADSIIPRL